MTSVSRSTEDLPLNATADLVQTALEKIPAIGDGSNETRAVTQNVASQAEQRLRAAQRATNSSQGVPANPTDPVNYDNTPRPPSDVIPAEDSSSS